MSFRYVEMRLSITFTVVDIKRAKDDKVRFEGVSKVLINRMCLSTRICMISFRKGQCTLLSLDLFLAK